jgi:hypothetical protein
MRRRTRKLPLLLALGLLAAGQAAPQTAEQLPPIAGPSRPDFGQPPSLDQPPAERLPPSLPPERFGSPPPGPGLPELRQAEEQRRARWGAVVEEEFRATWGRYGCFPHPQRHGAWFYAFADRLGATAPEGQRLLHELVMERVAAYEPPLSAPERMGRDTQRWLDGVIGRMSRPSAPDYFCR